MSARKRLTQSEFDFIRAHLERQKQEHIEHIRRVLVERAKQRDIADELQMTVQGVSAMVARAWRTHVEHGERPDGWRAVHITLPEDVADLVEDLAQIARKRMTK
jgi:DNA-binding MarR family transcriptional regulator